MLENDYLRKTYAELSKHKYKSEAYFKKAYDSYEGIEQILITIQN